MRINDVRMDVLYEALRSECKRISGDTIELYRLDDRFGKKGFVRFGVNWCAIGTVEVNQAEEFIEAGAKITRIAKAINDMKLEHDREADKDPELETAVLYDFAVKDVESMIRTEAMFELYRWIENGNK